MSVGLMRLAKAFRHVNKPCLPPLRSFQRGVSQGFYALMTLKFYACPE